MSNTGDLTSNNPLNPLIEAASRGPGQLPAYPLITPEHVVPAVKWLVHQIEKKMARIESALAAGKEKSEKSWSAIMVPLEGVAVHKSVYFASGWANYRTARKGSLRQSPPARILEELEKDYALMAPMFFREIPRWDQILKTIEDFEREFNA